MANQEERPPLPPYRELSDLEREKQHLDRQLAEAASRRDPEDFKNLIQQRNRLVERFISHPEYLHEWEQSRLDQLDTLGKSHYLQLQNEYIKRMEKLEVMRHDRDWKNDLEFKYTYSDARKIYDKMRDDPHFEINQVHEELNRINFKYRSQEHIAQAREWVEWTEREERSKQAAQMPASPQKQLEELRGRLAALDAERDKLATEIEKRSLLYEKPAPKQSPEKPGSPALEELYQRQTSLELARSAATRSGDRDAYDTTHKQLTALRSAIRRHPDSQKEQELARDSHEQERERDRGDGRER
jgi:hypothetical protein